jgi:hypothetical protein
LYEKFLNFLNEKSSAFLMKSNAESNLIYYSYSTQKLVKKTHICDSYSDFYLINWINDCLVEILIKTYECLPRNGTNFFIDFKKHLILKKYKFCDKNFKFDKSVMFDFRYKCHSKCLFSSCNQNIIETFKTLNSTKLNLIPKDFPHLRFIETFKLDINGLVYKFDGIIGLWFGLSLVSLVFLVTNIRSNISKILRICELYFISHIITLISVIKSNYKNHF